MTPPSFSPSALLTLSANYSAHASGKGHRILLVEDNAPAIIQLTDILTAQGYQVQVARDGREALALIDQCLPEAMILDLMMPEVDGFHVLQAIRSEERTAQVPVLILTAKHVTKEELSFLTGNHIHQLIQKGDINKDGLLAAVARMVAPLQTSGGQDARATVVRASCPDSSVPCPTHARAAVSPLRRRPTGPGQALILVVEDNPDNLCTLRALLGNDYRILTAKDGQAGIEQARLHRPDLILTDLALPIMDGFSELEVIRQDESLRDIPVIAVTASAMKGHREEILACGFDGYISKPIDNDTLQQILQQFLHP